MGYPNLDNYKDELKGYVIDALKQRQLLELALIDETKAIFIEEVAPIVNQIKYQKGNFKGITKPLEKALENAKKGLNEKLSFCLYKTLRKGAAIALSISARLKVDELIFQNETQKATGELAIIGEARTKDTNVIVKKTQSDISKKSDDIANHIIEKKRIYGEKEFKISSRVWDLSNGAVTTIQDIVKNGIGMDCKKLALMLEKYVATGSSKPIKEYPNMMKRLKGRFPPDLSFAAMRLARNELSELYFRTSIKDYLENPYVEAVQWLLANNRLKMYEDKCDCNDIAYEDVYGLGRGIYPLDKVPDRPHVMCLCTLAPITRRKLKKQREGGMKLGNVPTKEWFEKQNHEDNVQLIKSKERETGLRFFHNENGKALGLASIDIIKEYKWFNTGVHDEDKRAFLDDLHKVNGKYLYILARHTKNMQVDFYYSGKNGNNYNHLTNKVYCNLIKDAIRIENKKLGFNLGMSAFLHEAGHWLDSNLLNTSYGVSIKLDNLFTLIEYDVISYINKMGYEKYKSDFKPIKDLELKTIASLNKELRSLITNSIGKDAAINSNISDLYGAMTHEIIAGNVFNGLTGHKYDYWQREDKSVYSLKVTSEAIAEMFESFSNINRIKAMQSFLPYSWIYFNKHVNNLF